MFTVHAPPGATDAEEQAVFIKDGFSWPAFFFPLFWLLYHRMWLEFAVVIALVIALEIALGALGLKEAALVAACVGFNLLFAFEANDLRRARLDRKGWRRLGLAAGRGLSDAELDFYRAGSHGGRAGAPPSAMPAAQRSMTPGRPAPYRPSGEDDDVIGALPARL
jgi:hypothetical protein